MAIKKAVKNTFGAESTYWRIIRINENFNGCTDVYLAGYLDEESRRDNKEPMDMRIFQFEERDANRTSVYNLIMKSRLSENGEEINIFADGVEI